MSANTKPENFRPPKNNPPDDTLIGTITFLGRRALDLQVASVYAHLKPWLEKISGSLLEVGCGAQPYRHLVNTCCNYTGLDWEQAEAHFSYRQPDTIYYNGERFPFDDDSFDNLFHTEVLEHLYHGTQFLAECRRVLKPSGELFFTVPFQARYHYIPNDFFRYTPAALERMLTEAGFKEILITARGSDITVACSKILSLTYRWLGSGLSGVPAGILSFPLAIPSLILGHLSLSFLLGSQDDCLGYAVTAR